MWQSFAKTCHVGQMVGKRNQNVKPTPLKPVPKFYEPLNMVIIDCVGSMPMPKSGNSYLLTIMHASTRFPEVIHLRIKYHPRSLSRL